MTNPQTNFFKDTSVMTTEERETYEYEMAFHINTYTVDTINDFPDIESSNYAQA
jgi:hypothetical protein